MAKTLPAAEQSPVIEELRITLDPDTGDVNGLTAVLNVAYGTVHARENLDLWDVMNIGERTSFQNSTYARLTAEIASVYA